MYYQWQPQVHISISLECLYNNDLRWVQAENVEVAVVRIVKLTISTDINQRFVKAATMLLVVRMYQRPKKLRELFCQLSVYPKMLYLFRRQIAIIDVLFPEIKECGYACMSCASREGPCVSKAACNSVVNTLTKRLIIFLSHMWNTKSAPIHWWPTHVQVSFETRFVET